MTDYSGFAHFGDYWPPDFGWGGANDPEAHASMLVPFMFDSVTFGRVHRYAAPVFRALLTELVPHIQGGLKPGSCWGYSTTDNLPDGTRSFHSFGTAIDVNWNVNHMGTDIPDAHGRYAIPRALATTLARKYGCEWGGDWLNGYHDNMHFEVHLPPGVARGVAMPTAPTPAPTPAPRKDDEMFVCQIDQSSVPHGATTYRGWFLFTGSKLVYIDGAAGKTNNGTNLLRQCGQSAPVQITQSFFERLAKL